MIICSPFSWSEDTSFNTTTPESLTKSPDKHHPHSSFTQGTIFKNNNFSGLLASLFLEYKQTSDRVKETFIGTGGPFNDATGQKTSGRLSAQGISGGIHVGYGYQYLCSYFGLDVDFSIHQLVDHLKVNKGTNYDFSNHHLRIKKDYTLDLSFRCGYIFGRTMPFLRAGIAFSRWGIKTTYPSLATLGALGIRPTHHNHKNKVGFLVGTGVDFKYSSHIILGGYVTYTQFGTLKHTHHLVAKTKITTSDLKAGLKISYLF